jgi:hypothetical protein
MSAKKKEPAKPAAEEPEKLKEAKVPEESAVKEAINNRIVGHGEERVDQIVFNPMNWRIHPKKQRIALEGELEKIGLVQTVIVNQQTGNLVDGHLRVLILDAKGIETVPVTYVDLSPDEELEILATFDKITTMAGVDIKKLDEITQSLKMNEQKLQPLAKDMHDQLRKLEEKADLAEEDAEMSLIPPTIEEVDNAADQGGISSIPAALPGTIALKDDVRFDTDLPWDIPHLREDMLGRIPDGYTLRPWLFSDQDQDTEETFWIYNWGRESMRGLPSDRLLVAFYVEDWRFEPFYERPAQWTGKMLNAGIRLAISPNYSLYSFRERAVHLFNTFRSRWLGRYMQEAGIEVIPDVNWCDDSSFEFCLLGIPKNAPMLGIQLQTFNEKNPADVRSTKSGLEHIIKTLSPQELLLYGNKPGLALAEQVCRSHSTPFRFVPSRAAAIQAKKAATRAEGTGKAVA